MCCGTGPEHARCVFQAHGAAGKPAQLVVRDAFGKVVRQIDLDSAMGVVMPLEVHNLVPGVYIISLIQDQQLMGSKRLVVQP